MYGTDATSNAEMLSHYGFVDGSHAAADRAMVAAAPQMLPALHRSTLAEDEGLLKKGELPRQEELAVRFRLALKRAAATLDTAA